MSLTAPPQRCWLARRGVFYVLVEPAEHLVDELLVGFHGRVPVGLVGEDDEPSGAAVAADGFVEFGGLHGDSAGVGVVSAVNDEQRGLDLVGVEKWRDFQIHVLRLPHGALLILKA